MSILSLSFHGFVLRTRNSLLWLLVSASSLSLNACIAAEPSQTPLKHPRIEQACAVLSGREKGDEPNAERALLDGGKESLVPLLSEVAQSEKKLSEPLIAIWSKLLNTKPICTASIEFAFDKDLQKVSSFYKLTYDAINQISEQRKCEIFSGINSKRLSAPSWECYIRASSFLISMAAMTVPEFLADAPQFDSIHDKLRSIGSLAIPALQQIENAFDPDRILEDKRSEILSKILTRQSQLRQLHESKMRIMTPDAREMYAFTRGLGGFYIPNEETTKLQTDLLLLPFDAPNRDLAPLHNRLKQTLTVLYEDRDDHLREYAIRLLGKTPSKVQGANGGEEKTLRALEALHDHFVTNKYALGRAITAMETVRLLRSYRSARVSDSAIDRGVSILMVAMEGVDVESALAGYDIIFATLISRMNNHFSRDPTDLRSVFEFNDGEKRHIARFTLRMSDFYYRVNELQKCLDCCNVFGNCLFRWQLSPRDFPNGEFSEMMAFWSFREANARLFLNDCARARRVVDKFFNTIKAAKHSEVNEDLRAKCVLVKAQILTDSGLPRQAVDFLTVEMKQKEFESPYYRLSGRQLLATARVALGDTDGMENELNEIIGMSAKLHSDMASGLAYETLAQLRILKSAQADAVLAQTKGVEFLRRAVGDRHPLVGRANARLKNMTSQKAK